MKMKILADFQICISAPVKNRFCFSPDPIYTQSAFICSKFSIETLEQGVEYVQS